MQWNRSNADTFGTHSKGPDRRVSLYQGLFYMRKIRLGLHAVSALQWMPAFRRCSQGGSSTVRNNSTDVL